MNSTNTQIAGAIATFGPGIIRQNNDRLGHNFGPTSLLNYRGHRPQGSRDARLKFSTTAPTVAQSAQAAWDYLWVPPTWSTTAGINYTRRFGRYTARFQLNVSNVLNDDDPQWNSYSVIQAGQLTGQANAPSPAQVRACKSWAASTRPSRGSSRSPPQSAISSGRGSLPAVALGRRRVPLRWQAARASARYAA